MKLTDDMRRLKHALDVPTVTLLDLLGLPSAPTGVRGTRRHVVKGMLAGLTYPFPDTFDRETLTEYRRSILRLHPEQRSEGDRWLLERMQTQRWRNAMELPMTRQARTAILMGTYGNKQHNLRRKPLRHNKRKPT